MGKVSSSGLVSGLDTQSLIKQLMAIESKPLDLVKQQIKSAQAVQTAFLDLGARLTSSLASLSQLARISTFTVRSAASSNPTVLSAKADASTAVGSYSFRVLSLAATHQLVSAGLPTRDKSPVGSGMLTFEASAGRLDTSTSLSMLNGTGVRQGIIRVTDRAGNRAEIDLRGATTINDVIEAFNNQLDVNVQAHTDGDRLVIVDTSESGTGRLRIQDVGGGYTAADLGIAQVSETGRITGQDLVRLTENTRLSTLNDGLGIRAGSTGVDLRISLGDGGPIDVSLARTPQLGTRLAALNQGAGVSDGTFRITNRRGESAEIAVSAGGTLGDVVAAIQASGLSVSATIVGSRLVISDTTQSTASNLKIEDVSGTAAADLGIKADVAGPSVSGSDVYRMETIGDLFRAIQYAAGNDGRVVAGFSADGNRIVLTQNTGSDKTTIEALNGSKAAEDLGWLGEFNGISRESHELVAGLNTVLLRTLNGGQGVGTGRVQFTRRDGTSIEVDFTGARTLDDVIKRINSAADASGNPAGLSARVDPGGTGISIQDTTAGTGSLAVVDLVGTTAADLHLTASAGDTLSSGDLQKKYISESTLLSDLNNGAGIRFGRFRIATADGKAADVNLVATAQRTIGDVLRAINDAGLPVTARVNANGDGIELVDASGGGARLTVTERDNGGVAASLGILGQAKEGASVLTGSFARQIEVTGGDTLDTLVQKINGANAGVIASVLNDGSGTSPYRLVITSAASGRKGQIAYSSTVAGFSLGTMAEARDAVVAVGSGSGLNPMLVTSSTNTVTGLADGLTLNLTATSQEPVTVTVAQDVESLVSSMNGFVKAINGLMDRIAELTRFDPDTQQKGILLGDHTVRQVQDQVYSLLTRKITGQGLAYTNLTQVGLSISSGATLTFDEGKFREAYEKDPEAVQKLFTLTTKSSDGKTVNVGIGLQLKDLIERFTNSETGTLTKQANAVQEKVDLYNARAAHLQTLLGQKEARLYAQFNAMELALAELQSQQTALANLSSMWTLNSDSK